MKKPYNPYKSRIEEILRDFEHLLYQRRDIVIDFCNDLTNGELIMILNLIRGQGYEPIFTESEQNEEDIEREILRTLKTRKPSNE